MAHRIGIAFALVGAMSVLRVVAGCSTSNSQCAPSACTGSCLSGRHNASTMVDGCQVWECCVPDDAGEATSGESEASTAPSTCQWPASLNDAGPGACSVGRAYVKCTYPTGVSCEGGEGASSRQGGLTMLCISDDLTSCSGCGSTAGTATCTDLCAPNEYGLSCGGPPHFNPDGGGDNFTYQEPPANCVGMGGTPAGNGYYCCPCE
jgi:hypothetical protein